ncbi:MAG: Holliday junction branch migration protein RuvA [Chromatiales bacterium]|jgi:Holliday junction DNA helicase RuvA|nr:Holliday junction branch migration protein RuvA [Chromatiales bacterium]MDX9766474.1 Holliday junction branch migration protein RuvA [Ectothiorhodospiraceae bacterium]
MIGRLRGELVFKQPPHLLIDVGGVGYEIEAPLSTFYDLPEVGGTVTLFTHLHVREDAHVLYGFGRETDRALFRSLIRVNGVGAKMALAILSGMSADEFARCLREGNVAALTRLPGIGKKTAERLLVEMRDRVDGLGEGTALSVGGAISAVPADPATEAIAALASLGYKPAEAERMVKGVAAPDLDSGEIIRRALKASLR